MINRNILSNLVALLCSLLFCAVLLLAIYVFRAKRYYDHNKPQFVGETFIKEDELIGFSQRPNITMRHITAPVFSVYTDNLGGRADRAGTVAPMQVDILGVGCSFAWGHGIAGDKTYLSWLSHKMNLPAFNAALASYGTSAALLSIKKFGFLKPKVIVYGVIDDHIRRSMSPCAPCVSPFCRSVAFVDFSSTGEPYLHKPSFSSPLYYKYFREIVLEHPFGIKDVIWAVRRDIDRLFKRDAYGITARFRSFDDLEKRSRASQFLINELVRNSRAIKANLIIVYMPIPTKIQAPSANLLQAIMNYKDASDVFFLDMTDVFLKYEKAHGKNSLKASDGDGHPNEIAHQLIGKSLEPILAKYLKSS